MTSLRAYDTIVLKFLSCLRVEIALDVLLRSLYELFVTYLELCDVCKLREINIKVVAYLVDVVCNVLACEVLRLERCI